MVERRNKDFSAVKKYKEELADVYDAVVEAFQDKNERNQAVERFWKIYNCELSTNQAYSGENCVYLPIIHDAIEARVTRFTNRLFPRTGQHVDVTSYPGDNPFALMSLLNHYVFKARLRSQTKALLRNGEVEGQYSIYVYWDEVERYITKKSEKQVEISKGVFDPDETYLDVEDDVVTDAGPRVDLISDADLCIVPATVSCIEDAEIVCRKLYLTPAGVRKMVADGLFTAEGGDALLTLFNKDYDDTNSDQWHKKQAEAAGVRLRAGKGAGGKAKIAVVYEVWTKMQIGGDKKGKFRWCRAFFGAEDLLLGLTVNPFWNDRCPVISSSAVKLEGSFWGKSRIDAVEQTQYLANDAVNMAADSMMYSLLPIVMTDPEKNPNVGSMVINMAAIWLTNPNDTQFVNMPQLWKDALEFVSAAKNQIMESFGLNPAMMPAGGGPRKPTQAEVAQEQEVALVSIDDEVTTLEDELYTPFLQFAFELDQQHRDDAMFVKVWGQLGIAAQMQEVPPFAWDDRYEFRWLGVDMAQSAQQVQQMIGGLNILRSLPPVLPDGKRIDLTPIIEAMVNATFGPRLGSRILIDARDQLSVPPTTENDIMRQGGAMPVHWMDNDVEHLQSHYQAAEMTGDPSGTIRAHMLLHTQQLQQKNSQANPGGLPGSPGAPPPQPGIAGTPRPGALPQPPTGAQQPPGAIHPDQMQDPGAMPRKALVRAV